MGHKETSLHTRGSDRKAGGRGHTATPRLSWRKQTHAGDIFGGQNLQDMKFQGGLEG